MKCDDLVIDGNARIRNVPKDATHQTAVRVYPCDPDHLMIQIRAKRGSQPVIAGMPLTYEEATRLLAHLTRLIGERMEYDHE